MMDTDAYQLDRDAVVSAGIKPCVQQAWTIDWHYAEFALSEAPVEWGWSHKWHVDGHAMSTRLSPKSEGDKWKWWRRCMIAGALPFLTAMLSSSEPSVHWAALDALYALLLGSNQTQTVDAVMSTGEVMQSLTKAVLVLVSLGSMK